MLRLNVTDDLLHCPPPSSLSLHRMIDSSSPNWITFSRPARDVRCRCVSFMGQCVANGRLLQPIRGTKKETSQKLNITLDPAELIYWRYILYMFCPVWGGGELCVSRLNDMYVCWLFVLFISFFVSLKLKMLYCVNVIKYESLVSLCCSSAMRLAAHALSIKFITWYKSDKRPHLSSPCEYFADRLRLTAEGVDDEPCRKGDGGADPRDTRSAWLVSCSYTERI